MPNITILVGPAGSGKSTYAKKLINEDGDHGAATVYINQDSQGKKHLEWFNRALDNNKDIIIDRMNFDASQRHRYLGPAKLKGYDTEIIVLHENYDTCLARMLKRTGHETIQDEQSARSALQTFFTKYERPTQWEADKITFIYPQGKKEIVVWCDLDGTVADCEHRRHFVRPNGGEKKDWVGFFKAMSEDKPIMPIITLLHALSENYKIVYCSGRPDDYKKITEEWLAKNRIYYFFDPETSRGYVPGLHMRRRHDSRQDNIVKEIMLDFEILTRYNVFVCLDDRDQVVKMLRERGLTVLQVADGGF